MRINSLICTQNAAMQSAGSTGPPTHLCAQAGIIKQVQLLTCKQTHLIPAEWPCGQIACASPVHFLVLLVELYMFWSKSTFSSLIFLSRVATVVDCFILFYFLNFEPICQGAIVASFRNFQEANKNYFIIWSV